MSLIWRSWAGFSAGVYAFMAEVVENLDPHLDPRKANYAFFYVWIVEQACRWARSKGWAMAVHGSMRRDLDILATPWTQEAVSAEAFVAALAEEVNGILRNNVETKPHGRRAYSICLGGHPYIDLSIVDPRPPIDSVNIPPAPAVEAGSVVIASAGEYGDQGTGTTSPANTRTGGMMSGCSGDHCE